MFHRYPTLRRKIKFFLWWKKFPIFDIINLIDVVMKYFIDTEFLEGKQDTLFKGKLGRWVTHHYKPTIDLISIGIVSEDGREYYAISKDFNLDEAWNRFQMKQVYGDARNRYTDGVKEYWIRENVLKPIFDELINRLALEKYNRIFDTSNYIKFTYSNFKKLIKIYGKSNKQIANEIIKFVGSSNLLINEEESFIDKSINFYAYYADYDWVVFCWLFGRMIDLPKGFPMYCKDLKQILDKKANELINRVCYESGNHTIWNLQRGLEEIKKSNSYPKIEDEHNALADARWNKKLYEFLKNLE